MAYITTAGGRHFDPVQPELDKINIEDIAHALSLLCRGNGHVKHFYSVGQHCIACAREAAARGYHPRIQLAALLHDAAEAYMCDLPSPIKNEMPAYRLIEEKLLQLIWEKYLRKALTEEEVRLVMTIDMDMRYLEFHMLMAEELAGEHGEILAEISCEYRDFAEVEALYLQMAEELADKMLSDEMLSEEMQT